MIKIIESNDKYIRTYFRIDAGYEWGQGWVDTADRYAFYEEVTNLFEDNGFIIMGSDFSGACPEAVKPGTKEKLYLHPMEFTGPVLENDIPKIEKMLQGAETFRCYRVDTYEEIYDMTDNEYLAYLENHRDEIEQDILSLIGNKPTHINIYGDNKVYRKWHLSRTSAYVGVITSDDIDVKFFENVLQDLVDSGAIVKVGYNTYKLG